MITEEQLKELKPEGFEDSAWNEISSKFMAMHEVDINGLKNTNTALKKEKTDAIEAYRSSKAEWETTKQQYETSIAGLNEQLKKNSPESIKAAFDIKEKDLIDKLEESKNAYEKKLLEKDEKIEILERGVFERDCYEAFDKAIKDKNIDPSAVSEARILALGENCSKFKRTDMGDGKTMITRADGKDIASSVAEFLSTPLGKRFVVVGSSGGGADGGKDTTTEPETMTRAAFEALGPAERAVAVRKYKII